MIELSWKTYSEENNRSLFSLMNILAWLSSALTEEKFRKVKLMGHVVINDSDEKRLSALFFCEGASQKVIMNLLEHPPSMYEDCFDVRAITDEPLPVEEVEPGDMMVVKTLSVDDVGDKTEG